MLLFFFGNTGGWREREKAREESWGPPRDSGSHDDDDDDDHDRDERNDGERFRERRPPRCSSLPLCDQQKFLVFVTKCCSKYVMVCV